MDRRDIELLIRIAETTGDGAASAVASELLAKIVIVMGAAMDDELSRSPEVAKVLAAANLPLSQSPFRHAPELSRLSLFQPGMVPDPFAALEPTLPESQPQPPVDRASNCSCRRGKGEDEVPADRGSVNGAASIAVKLRDGGVVTEIWVSDELRRHPGAVDQIFERARATRCTDSERIA